MSAPRLPPGSVVAGKYRVTMLLGFGGATATYRATAQNGAEVALKLFSPQVGQNAAAMKNIERIYAETNALGQDLVAPILDAGFDPQTASPFSATPLLQTPSLQAVVQRTPMGLPDVAGLLAALARILDAAHIRHLFHHALKPTNVFLTPSPGGAPRDVRLTDFGVGSARSVVQTHEGYSLAAPWLAPEQLQQGVQAGAAADVFSAALVAFYALVGTSFWRSCQTAQPDLQAWQAELFGGRAVATLRASEARVPLHSGLDPIFARALAADPSQRFRTVGELAAAIDQVANARAPEAATTMAFPAISDMDVAAAPPPAAGAYAAPGMAAGGYPPPPQPMGAPGATQPGPGGPSPYVAAQDLGAAAPAPPAKSGGAGKFIGIGLAVAVLGGGGWWGFRWWQAKKTIEAATAAASSGPISVDVPPSTAKVDTPPPPPPSSTPAPDSTGTPVASATSSAAAQPGIELKVTCKPGCDEIKVDDQAVADVTKPLSLQPGEHTLTFSKAGHKTVTEKVTAVAGKPLLPKLVTLPQEVAVAPTPPPPPPPPPPPATGKPTVKPPVTGVKPPPPPACKPTKFKKCP